MPRRYEEPSGAAIEDLFEKVVLKRVSEVMDWCSPGFFVAKLNGRVRLVTDFTHLNRYFNRPVHPFPSTRYILQSIPHDAVYCLKMDAVHGYFQLALSEESSFLTTCLLQQGKFRYLRAPMGLNASLDEWCCHSDRMVVGLPWAKKIVDDMIIWAPTLEELEERAHIILQRCRELNITISLKKLEMGKDTFMLSPLYMSVSMKYKSVKNNTSK